MKNAPNLPFDVNYKVRQDALKNRLEQRGIFVSSMKYKSKYGSYYDKIRKKTPSFPPYSGFSCIPEDC
ncbi:MAG: hypothetical protein WAM14_21925 [Candidatus Nitrosopolaris sp.]